MIKVFVDTGSSIKFEEAEKLNVELIPLRYSMGENEYVDGVDITIDEFYKKLIDEKLFPKTSLPNLDELQERVEKCTKQGNDVIIITISGEISSTNASIKQLFASNDRVFVIDSRCAVGGMRLLVEEVNKYRDLPVKEVVAKVEELIPRIRIFAIPETLDYLLKGGRLSKKEWLLGSVLNIKPVITFTDGNVRVATKKIGLKSAMKFIVNEVEQHADENFSIVPSYTYNNGNLHDLLAMTDKKFHKCMTSEDNLDPAIACHWGPNAFGYIFVDKHVTEPKFRLFPFGKDEKK